MACPPPECKHAMSALFFRRMHVLENDDRTAAAPGMAPARRRRLLPVAPGKIIRSPADVPRRVRVLLQPGLENRLRMAFIHEPRNPADANSVEAPGVAGFTVNWQDSIVAQPVHRELGRQHGFVGVTEQVGRANESAFIISKGGAAHPPVAADVVGDAARRRIKKSGPFPEKKVGRLGNVSRVVQGAAQKRRRDGRRAVYQAEGPSDRGRPHPPRSCGGR